MLSRSVHPTACCPCTLAQISGVLKEKMKETLAHTARIINQEQLVFTLNHYYMDTLNQLKDAVNKATKAGTPELRNTKYGGTYPNPDYPSEILKGVTSTASISGELRAEIQVCFCQSSTYLGRTRQQVFSRLAVCAR